MKKLRNAITWVLTLAMLTTSIDAEAFSRIYSGCTGEEAVSEDESSVSVDEPSASSDELIEGDDAETVSSDGMQEEDIDVPEEAGASGEDEDIDEDVDIEAYEAENLVIVGNELYSKETNVYLGTFDSDTGEVVIDAGLEFVPSDLFAGWDQIKSLSFQSGSIANSIGNNDDAKGAFAGCCFLESVDLTNASELTTIRSYAFSSCTALTTVKLNDELNFIEGSAFQNTAITEIEFGSKLTSIGTSAFQNCKDLHKIILNNTNTTSVAGVFKGCNIDSFELAVNEKGHAVLPADFFNGAGFDKDAEIDIGASVVEISEGAFCNSNIAHVKLPEELIVVGDRAFSGCKYLKEIDFTPCKEYNAPLSIGDTAFKGCEGVTELTLPDRINKIGDSAFYGCKKIATLTLSAGTKVEGSDSEENPGNILGKSIFENCVSISDVTFPEGLDYVGVAEFKGCSGITNITFSSTIVNMGAEAFANCTSLENVELPINEGFGEVPSGCFSGCTKLLTVTMRGGIKSIGAKAFNNCIKLHTVDMREGTESIGAQAFYNCVNLRNVELYEGLKTIGASAFYGCEQYRSTLPSTLETIGASAFYKCKRYKSVLPTALKSIGANAFYSCGFCNTLILPENLTEIGAGAFKECRDQFGYEGFKELNKVVIETKILDKCGAGIFNHCSISDIELANGATSIPANLFRQTTWETGKVIVIPNTVTSIGKGAFAGDSSLKETAGNLEAVVFGDGILLEEIGEEAFAYNPALAYKTYNDDPALREPFELPNSPDLRIGSRAFSKCLKLSEITIPENVIELGASVFEGCPLLEEVHFDAVSVNKCQANNFKDCNLKDIHIGEKVSILPDYLFSGARFQKSGTGEYIYVKLTLPESLTKIGISSLTNVVNLEEISFEGNSKLQTIGQYALSGCTGLKKMNLPASVKVIDNYAFQNCVNLGGFVLPESLESIGQGAFKGCENITEIIIPAEIKTINKELCSGCVKLERLSFAGDAVTSIADSAFLNCGSINDLEIPHSVTNIAQNAFKGCQLSGTLKLNEGCKTVGAAAFNSAGQKDYAIVYLPESLTSIGKGAFDVSFADRLEFHVVKGSYAEKWLKNNGFSDRVRIEYRVNFDLQGHGIEIPVQSVSENYTVEKPEDPVEEGWVFGGWYTDSGCTDEYDFSAPVTADITLYAKWDAEVKYFTVSFNVMEHGASVSSQNVAENSKAERPEDPVEEGWIFKGWYTDEDCTEKYDFDTPVTADITLYAKWEKEGEVKYYTVSFNMMDHGAAVPSQSVSANNKAERPENPSEEGWIFRGWYTDTAFTEEFDFDTPVTADITLYAKWEKEAGVICYTVSFDMMEHGVPVPSQSVSANNKAERPEDPTEEGWIFGGWYTDKECTEEYNFDTPVSADIILYAKWTEEKGPEPGPGDNSPLDPKPVIDDDTSELYLVKGQKFNIGTGWSVADSISKKYVSISKKGDLKAKKDTPGNVTVKIKKAGREDMIVHISTPSIPSKYTMIIDKPDATFTYNIPLSMDKNLKNVLWYSASPDVATVDQNGRVTAIAKGKAKISAYINGKAYNCTITVKESVSAVKRTMHLNIGASKTISVKGVKNWSSMSASVALMNSKGTKVTAKSAGKTELIATSGDVEYAIDFYAEDIAVSGKNVKMVKANKYVLEGIKPGEITDIDLPGVMQDVVFKSSKPDVAFIDENGHITARSKGTSKLTTKINGKTITITVKVFE